MGKKSRQPSPISSVMGPGKAQRMPPPNVYQKVGQLGPQDMAPNPGNIMKGARLPPPQSAANPGRVGQMIQLLRNRSM